MPTLTPNDSGFWEDHAIRADVRDARGYHCYRKGDPDRLLYEAWPADNNEFIRRKVAPACDEDFPAGGGLIIPRFAPPDLDLPHVYAEIRPKARVVTDPLRKPKGAKYVFPKGPKYAKRVDLHPQAVPLLEGAERIYFGIEGCLKADAILSEILKTGEKATVMSVPSVTLWPYRDDEDLLRPAELKLVAARYLRDKQVVIVPDADWLENWRVWRQAMLLQTFLRRRGLDAHIAAPPIRKGAAREKGKLKRNGVDDFLAVKGNTLEDLRVGDRPVPSLVVLARERWGGRKLRIDRHAAELLEALSLHSGIEPTEDDKARPNFGFTNDGTIRLPLATTGRILGMGPRKAQRTMVDLLEETDAISLIDGSTAFDDRWHFKGRPLTKEPELDPDGKPLRQGVYRSREYIERPTYRLREDFWPEDMTFRRLGSAGDLEPARTDVDDARMLREDFADKIVKTAGEPVRVTREEWEQLRARLRPFSHADVKRLRKETIVRLLPLLDNKTIIERMGSEQFPLSLRTVQRIRKEDRDMTLAQIAADVREIKALLTEQQAAELGRNSREAAISATAFANGETPADEWRSYFDAKNVAVLTPIEP